MGETERRSAERNAGAFLGPDVLVPTTIRTLSDDYRDEPTEPEDSDREPKPQPKGLIDRLRARLTRR
jgi:hypothetical protein